MVAANVLIPGLMGRCNVSMVQEVGGIQATYTDEAFSGLQEQAPLLDYEYWLS